jgi:hypothetical protein
MADSVAGAAVTGMETGGGGGGGVAAGSGGGGSGADAVGDQRPAVGMGDVLPAGFSHQR